MLEVLERLALGLDCLNDADLSRIVLVALCLGARGVPRGGAMGLAGRESLLSRRRRGVSTRTPGSSEILGRRGTHLVEESLGVVCPRDARKLHVADLLGKPLLVVRRTRVAHRRKRRRGGTDVDGEKVASLYGEENQLLGRRRHKAEERDSPNEKYRKQNTLPSGRTRWLQSLPYHRRKAGWAARFVRVSMKHPGLESNV